MSAVPVPWPPPCAAARAKLSWSIAHERPPRPWRPIFDTASRSAVRSISGMATIAISQAPRLLITSGVNEKTGGATDRNDPQGRLRLLDKNVGIYRDIIPKIV